MLSLLINAARQLAKTYRDWTGDHEMEMHLRRELTESGYFGKTAKFENVRLVAVQRPGWVQIYAFDVTARVDESFEEQQQDDSDLQPAFPVAQGLSSSATYHQICGLVRDDGRTKRPEVRFFADRKQRIGVFDEWSEGLMRLRGAGRL
ncbi:MAG: hypothetical protein AAFP90_07780 [Planctomycetota bacterium]